MTIKNIIIVGITGVGKTTIGKFLADSLNRKFIDLDKFIETSCGVDIPTIFELEGENGFRERESEALNQVINNYDDYVLSLGGGCVIRAENRHVIARNNNLVIQLIADLDVIVERLARSPNKRPLLANQDLKKKIEELYDTRRELYEMVSDVTINTTKLRPHQVISIVESHLDPSN